MKTKIIEKAMRPSITNTKLSAVKLTLEIINIPERKITKKPNTILKFVLKNSINRIPNIKQMKVNVII